jgi:hypothetical protein
VWRKRPARVPLVDAPSRHWSQLGNRVRPDAPIRKPRVHVPRAVRYVRVQPCLGSSPSAQNQSTRAPWGKVRAGWVGPAQGVESGAKSAAQESHPSQVEPLLVVNPPSEPRMTHDGSVSMGHEECGTRRLTVQVGSIVLRNTSHWLHVIVPGVDAHPETELGLPSLGRRNAHMSETGDVFRYGPLDTPGHCRLTCSLHPEMNLTVDVVPRTTPPAPAGHRRVQRPGHRHPPRLHRHAACALRCASTAPADRLPRAHLHLRSVDWL